MLQVFFFIKKLYANLGLILRYHTDISNKTLYISIKYYVVVVVILKIVHMSGVDPTCTENFLT